MSANPIPDPSQQPITAADPRVAQVLALIRAKTGQVPVDPTVTPSQGQVSAAPSPQFVLPDSPPPPVAGPQMTSPPPQLPPAPVPQVTPAPGPVKSFLQQLVSGLGGAAYQGTQGALSRLGIPTDYEKQQNALKMGLQQQQQNSLEGLRTAQQGLYEGKGAQLDQYNTPYSISADDKSVMPQFRGSTTTFGGYQALQKLSGANQGKMDVQSEKDAALLARAQAMAKDATTKFQHVAGSSNGVNTFANYDPSSGKYTDLKGNVLTDFKPANKAMQGALGGFAPAFAATRTLMAAYNENPALLPVLAPMLSKMLAPGNPDAERIFATAPSGQPQDVAGNPIGLRMPGAPTGATRSRGQFAQAVMPSIDDAKAQIAVLGDKLGPMAGRYNDLANAKIGAYGPEYTGLQTSLQNIGTAWMRLHANSEKAREDFQKVLASSQDPANLVANLDALQKQARDYVVEGQGTPGSLGGKAPTKGVHPDFFHPVTK